MLLISYWLDITLIDKFLRNVAVRFPERVFLQHLYSTARCLLGVKNSRIRLVVQERTWADKRTERDCSICHAGARYGVVVVGK